MKTYAEKLKDPRWQRKRLEILERDEFTCCHCQSTEKTLHVHHRIYLKGCAPWEYKDENFVTLCDECHADAERRRDTVIFNMGSCRGADRAIVNLSSVFSEDQVEFKCEIWREAAEELAYCIGYGATLQNQDADELSINISRECLKTAALSAVAAISAVANKLSEESL